MKKTDDGKYFVVNINGNDETVLFEYNDENAAKEKMTILGRKQKPDRGIICVVKGLINEDGLIDQRGRMDIAVYNRWLERILSE